MPTDTLEVKLHNIHALAQRREYALLVNQLDDRRPEVRLAILRTLADYHYDRLFPELIHGLSDRDEPVRRYCLERLMAGANAAAPDLAVGLRDRRRGPICAGLLALTHPGREVLQAQGSTAREMLLLALRDLHLPETLRAHAVLALERAAGEEVDDAIGGLLWRTNRVVTAAAVEVLMRRGTAAASDRLLRWLEQMWPAELPVIDWLSFQRDGRAKRILRRLASWRGRLFLPPQARERARLALERTESRYADVPDTSLSRSSGGDEPTGAALSRTVSEPADSPRRTDRHP